MKCPAAVGRMPEDAGSALYVDYVRDEEIIQRAIKNSSAIPVR